MRDGEHGAGPQADQRGRLRAAALSRRRKLRFAVGLLSQPARFTTLRLLFPKNLCFANLFREPCFTRFSCHFPFVFPWRVLGCGGAKRRRTRLCQAHATVPNQFSVLNQKTIVTQKCLEKMFTLCYTLCCKSISLQFRLAVV